jgi:hypothetical protein
MKAHGRHAAQTAAQDGEQQESLTFGRGKTKEKDLELFSDGIRDGLLTAARILLQEAMLPI